MGEKPDNSDEEQGLVKKFRLSECGFNRAYSCKVSHGKYLANNEDDEGHARFVEIMYCRVHCS